MTTHTVTVTGATIHYEVRGGGPVLVIAGSPMAARFFGRRPTRWPTPSP